MGSTGKPGEKVRFRLAHGTKPGINEDALRPGSFFLTSTHTWLPHECIDRVTTGCCYSIADDRPSVAPLSHCLARGYFSLRSHSGENGSGQK